MRITRKSNLYKKGSGEMLPKNKYPRHGKFTEDKSGNNSEVTKSKVTVNTIISKLNTEYINIMRRIS